MKTEYAQGWFVAFATTLPVLAILAGMFEYWRTGRKPKKPISMTTEQTELDDLIKKTTERTTNAAVDTLARANDQLRHYVLLDNAPADGDWGMRYYVVRMPGWWPLRGYAVRAGNGTMHYFEGSKKQCEEVARRCLTAFRDGHFVAWNEERKRLSDLFKEDLKRFAESESVDSLTQNHVACTIAANLQDDLDNVTYY